MEPIGKTDFKIFTKNDKEWRIIKNATLYNLFSFARIDFALIEFKGIYEVCAIKDKELYALCPHAKHNGNETYLPSEILSLFRKKFSKLGRTSKDIDDFIKNPKSFSKKHKKKLST